MKTAVEFLVERLSENGILHSSDIQQAKEMEKQQQQIFYSANTSAKEAYKAGQRSMECGCYEIDACTTFENWLYNRTFKSE